jgi:Zn-dependent peptidase ImmA (M78 family)
MSRSIKIEIEPVILKYARYCSGYDISAAAKKLKLSEEDLKNLEDEKQLISLAKVKRMSNVYKMPLTYFLLRKAPQDIVLPKDFRIVYESETEEFSPDVMLAIRRGRYIQSIINELQEEKIVYDFKQISINDNPENVAEYFREKIGISLEDQKKWRDSSMALRVWKDGIEKLGLFILQHSLSKDDISAFCLADQTPYVLMLNSAEHVNRRIFSLFHEIGHVLLHMSGICNPDNLSRNSYKYVQIEKFCNQFSAAFLVPVEDFESNAIVQALRHQDFEDWDQEKIYRLSNIYRVSREVIYRRLMSIGILEEKKYKSKRSELIKNFEEYKKIASSKEKKIPQYRKIISKNGRAFTSLVLRSMYDNKITMANVVDFLGTNSSHVSAVEANV